MLHIKLKWKKSRPTCKVILWIYIHPCFILELLLTWPDLFFNRNQLLFSIPVTHKHYRCVKWFVWIKNDFSNCESPCPHDVSHKICFNQKYSLAGDFVWEKIQEGGCLWFHNRYQNGMILDTPSHIALDSQVSSPLCIWSGYKMFATLGMYKENKLTEYLVASYAIFHFITQPPIYKVIVYFFAMSCLYTK